MRTTSHPTRSCRLFPGASLAPVSKCPGRTAVLCPMEVGGAKEPSDQLRGDEQESMR